MKKIISFAFVLCLLASAVICVSAEDDYIPQPPNPMTYAEKAFAKYNVDINSETFSWEDYYYKEIYEYYSDKEADISENSTPDYVLLKLNTCYFPDATYAMHLGPYIVSGSPVKWGTFAYHIYLPKEDILYSLEEAYELNVEGIDKVFTDADYYHCFVIAGDVDDNHVLNIKDATFIQKCISEILKFPSYDWVGRSVYISDFNRDRERNIKDATAIQKCIAGIEY